MEWAEGLCELVGAQGAGPNGGSEWGADEPADCRVGFPAGAACSSAEKAGCGEAGASSIQEQPLGYGPLEGEDPVGEAGDAQAA